MNNYFFPLRAHRRGREVTHLVIFLFFLRRLVSHEDMLNTLSADHSILTSAQLHHLTQFVKIAT